MFRLYFNDLFSTIGDYITVKKEKSNADLPFLDVKKRNLIKVDRAVYNKISSWKVKEFIIKNCEIIDKEEKDE